MPDDYTFTIAQAHGPDVTVTDAPSPLNRYDRGVKVLLTRIIIERKPCTISWDELRFWASEVGLFIDPRDDQPEAPGLRERYRNPVAAQIERLSGLW